MSPFSGLFQQNAGCVSVQYSISFLFRQLWKHDRGPEDQSSCVTATGAGSGVIGSRQWVIGGRVESGSTSHGPVRQRLTVKKFSNGSVCLVNNPYIPLMRTNFPCLVKAICEGELAVLTFDGP